MTVELRPFGVLCNIQCTYCYQNPQRDAGNVSKSYDLELMKSAIKREGGPFTLFGGEPLLLPERDLEELWSWGFQQFGKNSVQTNGTMIRDYHIRMFKQHRVQVGISIDGPRELNDLRWAGSLDATRMSTAKTESAIKLLCREGIPPSLIVTLHRINALPTKFLAMDEWFRELDSIGIRFVRLHILESETPAIRQKYALSTAENTEAFLHFCQLESSFNDLKFDVFADMERLLRGDGGKVSCIWGSCDPYTTAAVRGVEGHGQRSNCGRTNKDGISFVKEESAGFERYRRFTTQISNVVDVRVVDSF